MEERVHPIPFRTRQLSSPSSMILRILTWESRTTPRLYFQRAVLRRWPVVFLSCRHSCIPSAIPNQAILPLPPLFSSASPSLLPGFPPAFFQLPPGVLPSTPLEPSLSLSLSLSSLHHPRLQRKSLREYTPIIPYKQLATLLTSF